MVCHRSKYWSAARSPRSGCQAGRNIHKVIEQHGKKDGRIGGQNGWPVDKLQPGGVYACDHFSLKQDGPSIGDNVGNAVYASSHNGIFYGGAMRL